MPKTADFFAGHLRRQPQSGKPLRNFALLVALPSAAVYLGVCGLVFLAMHVMSAEMNAIDADRSNKAIAAAAESIVKRLGASAADEATWTEAYINTYIEPNPAWLDSTWGATARISDTYDTAILTDRDGLISFGETSTAPLTGNLGDHFSGAAMLLQELDEAVAQRGDDATVAQLTRTAGGVVVLAGAVVHGNTGQASVPRSERRILWLGKRFDDNLLRDVARRFQLPLPHLITGPPEAGATTMALTDAAGATLATVAWQPRRPGDPAFAHAASVAVMVMLVIGGLVSAVLTAFHASIMSRASADQRDWFSLRYDGVTGLFNNFGLGESLKAALRRNRPQPLAIALLGVDSFTDVVDSYGREAGDRLLETLAEIIEGEVAGKATLARIGPAEFALARVGEDAPAVVRGLATRLLTLGSEAVAVDDLKLKVGFSIGIADAVVDRAGSAELMRKAETALARARETGGRQLVDYDPFIEEERRARLELQADIRRGLDAGEFDLEYQPIIDFGSRSITGVEALMRWNRRQGGPLAPALFIPVAERSGLIDDLGMFALRRAVAEIGPLEGLKVSVNVSGMQLRNPGLAATISATLAESGMAANRLQLEVTESFLVAQPERAKRIIETLRAEGILIALDDFGTGYSSIGYLRQFQFDRLKLDRSLIENIDGDPVQSALVESAMVYAFAMGLGVTAEGVERREEAVALSRLGCREFQGYFFARPLTFPQLTRLLAGTSTALAG